MALKPSTARSVTRDVAPKSLTEMSAAEIVKEGRREIETHLEGRKTAPARTLQRSGSGKFADAAAGIAKRAGMVKRGFLQPPSPQPATPPVGPPRGATLWHRGGKAVLAAVRMTRVSGAAAHRIGFGGWGGKFTTRRTRQYAFPLHAVDDEDASAVASPALKSPAAFAFSRGSSAKAVTPHQIALSLHDLSVKLDTALARPGVAEAVKSAEVGSLLGTLHKAWTATSYHLSKLVAELDTRGDGPEEKPTAPPGTPCADTSLAGIRSAVERSKRSAQKLDSLAGKFPSKAKTLDPETLAKIHKNLVYTTEKVALLQQLAPKAKPVHSPQQDGESPAWPAPANVAFASQAGRRDAPLSQPGAVRVAMSPLPVFAGASPMQAVVGQNPFGASTPLAGASPFGAGASPFSRVVTRIPASATALKPVGLSTQH